MNTEVNRMHPKKIEQAFLVAGTDKAKTHGYHKHYSKVFSKVEPKSILEIGVKQGRSLAAWRMLFPDAEIAGVDISDKSFEKQALQFADASIVIQDSTVEQIRDKVATYDVIIDDGSHNYKDIINTFQNLHDRFINVYVIEDVMYGLDQIVSHIQSLGYNNIEVYDSDVKNVPVQLWWLIDPKNKTDSKETVSVNLQMVVVYR